MPKTEKEYSEHLSSMVRTETKTKIEKMRGSTSTSQYIRELLEEHTRRRK